MLLITGVLFMIGCEQASEESGKEGDPGNQDNKSLAETLLLKDWMPESIYKIPANEPQEATVPVIDMHAHDYTQSKEEVKKRVEIMDAAGIEKSMILTKKTGAEFDALMDKYAEYPDRFEVYCGFDFSKYPEEGWADHAVEELKRCVEAGAVGVGEVHDKGGGLNNASREEMDMHPDDPAMDPLFEACAELGIPVNIHVAEPIWMYEPMDSTNDGLIRAHTWRVKNQDKIVLHQGMMDILENMLERHPNTTFIAAHLANLTYDFAQLGRLLDNYPNLYADVSARFAEFATIPRTTADFFEEYQDRIVYGTDYGFETFDNNTEYGNNTTTLEMYRTTFRVLETRDDHFYLTDLVGYKWPMYGLDLSEEALEKIYRENALKILKMNK